MGRFQIALEQLKQQSEITTFHPSPLPTSSAISPTTALYNCNIPKDLELDNIYNPKYTVVQLISTRKKPRKQAIPPRPPNSFFLFKNCYMLELRKLGYRFCMPDICKQTKQIWANIPPEVRERYDILALQAQILHQEMYPEYKFSPKKRNVPKSRVLSSEATVIDSSMLSTFSLTNFLGNNSESFESPPSPPSPTDTCSTPLTPSPIIPSSCGPISVTDSKIESINFVDYNNLFYLNDTYLNSLNNLLTQGSTTFPEVNTACTQMLSPLSPLEIFEYSNNQNTFTNFL